MEEIIGLMINGQVLGSEDIKLSHRLEGYPPSCFLRKAASTLILHMGPEWLFQKGCPFLARRHEYTEVQGISSVGYTGGEGSKPRLWNLQNLCPVPPYAKRLCAKAHYYMNLAAAK